MLQKNKSARVALFKYFLSAPLFILMLVLSSATVNNSKAIHVINNHVERVFLIAPGASTGSQVRYNDQKQSQQIYQLSKSSAILQAADITIVEDTIPKRNGPVFTSVEKVPEFPGGINAFLQFLSRTVKYPEQARENNVQGRVIISFIVETDGSLTNIRVVRGVGSGTDEEAIRALKLSPKWLPGYQNHHKVRVAYSVPINFALSEDSSAAGNKTGAVDNTDNQNSTVVINKNATPDTGKYSLNLTGPLYLSSNSPVYVVDGLQVDNLNYLNPDDIQSISVVKDKNMTLIYGDKGKNGAIVVTTKKNALKLKKVTPVKN